MELHKLLGLLAILGVVGVGLSHPHNITCQPQNPHQPRNVLEATDWLSRYGYISTAVSWAQGLAEMVDLKEAISVFQQLARIKVTGKLDELTLKWMGKDRCGVPDVINRQDGRYRRNAGALKWEKYDLTYIVTRYTPDLSRDHVDRTLAQAFKVWADVTPLTFIPVRIKDGVDIEIKFVHGVHGDNNPFDGEGGVLAHAFFPPTYPENLIGGDTHFDESERWTIELDDKAPGRRLFCVAVHEFGHALGLDHSDQQGSIMWPWSQGCGNGTLDPSDITNIQRLYGAPGSATTTLTTQVPTTVRKKPTRGNTKKPKRTRPTRKPTTRKQKPDKKTTVPAKPTTKRPTTRKKKTTEETTPVPTKPTTRKKKPTERTTRIPKTTPSSTKNAFTRKPRTEKPTRLTTKLSTTTTSPPTTVHPKPFCRGDGKLDAVDLAPDGNVYGFKGSQIFRFKDFQIDFPKPIKSVFKAGPSTVDAVVSFYYKTKWTRRVKYITLLFKDNLVWKYEYKRENLLQLWKPKVFVIKKGYPKTIQEELKIKTKFIDAAFRLKKKYTFYVTRGDYIWEIQVHRSAYKTKKVKRMSKDPALSYLPPLDSAALFNTGGFFFFSGDFYHQLLPIDRKRARWMWPGFSLNAWFQCNIDYLVPLSLEAEKMDYATEIDFKS